MGSVLFLFFLFTFSHVFVCSRSGFMDTPHRTDSTKRCVCIDNVYTVVLLAVFISLFNLDSGLAALRALVRRDLCGQIAFKQGVVIPAVIDLKLNDALLSGWGRWWTCTSRCVVAECRHNATSFRQVYRETTPGRPCSTDNDRSIAERQ